MKKSEILTHKKQHKGQTNVKMGSEILTHENKHKGPTKFLSHVNIQQQNLATKTCHPRNYISSYIHII